MTITTYSTNGIESDDQWARQAFFQPFTSNPKSRRYAEPSKIKDAERRGRRFSTAELKYTDTTPGGNFAINPRPQFTRWADPKMPGLSKASKGMGMYYSEAIDDTAQRIHLQFGIPEYNSLTNFFTRFYDHEMGLMVNSGAASQIPFGTGKAAGFLLTLPLQPIIGFVNLYNKLVSFAKGNPQSQFYYMKPVMPQYWSAVTAMLNRITNGMGITEGPEPTVLGGEPKDNKPNGKGYGNPIDPTVLNNMLPDVMRAGGGIDVHAVATRGQRLANQHEKKMKSLMEGPGSGGWDSYQQAVENYITTKMDPPKPSKWDDGSGSSLYNYLNDYYKGGPIGGEEPKEQLADRVRNLHDKDAADQYSKERVEVAYKNLTDTDYFTGELTDGGAFVTFNVDAEGSVSESFSSNTKSSDVENKFNSASSGARNLNFNLAGGNLGDGLFTNTMESIMGGVKQFAMGLASSVGLDGIGALGGAAYVDMPEFWESASAQLPQSSYTVKLASPYGNKLSILINIYLPLCCLLAGALPRSTGKNSYSSPFLVRLHSTGRNIIKLGVIDSIQITRGTGGIGWSVDGLPTAVDVTFSVKNLNKIMHMPVSDVAGPLDAMSLSAFDEDTAYTDYLAALSGIGLYDQFYIAPRARLAWQNQITDLETWMSPSRWASHFVGSAPGRLMSAIWKGTDRY